MPSSQNNRGVGDEANHLYGLPTYQPSGMHSERSTVKSLRYTGAMIERLALLFAGFLVTIPPAFGQLSAIESPAYKTEKAIVAQLLSSTEPSQLAWGAYLAANYQQKNFVPAIIPLLRFSDSGVRLVAIDALIRLDADVADDDLSIFLASNPIRLDADPALVLMAKDPKKHTDLLMRLLDQLNNSGWVAVNEILLADPQPGYAAHLLRDWKVHFNVKVWDGPVGIGDGGCGWFGPQRVEEARQGFPTISEYFIHEGATKGATMIGAGPHPVSYLRQEPANRGGPCIDKDAYRLDYLKSLARFAPDSKLVKFPFPNQDFQWIDAAKYQADADALLTGIRMVVSNIRTALIARGLATKEEVNAGPKLEIVVTDQRRNTRYPLPVIDWRLDR